MENRNTFRTLKTREQFNYVIKKGRRFKPNDWLSLQFVENQLTTNEFGWTIPTYVGSAVIRNKFKRWLRSLLRKSEMKGLTVHFYFLKKNKDFYKELSRAHFDKALNDGLLKAISRMEKK